jgi:cysteinyl-tRNA synthetase
MRKVWLLGLLGLLACNATPIAEPEFDPDALACTPAECTVEEASLEPLAIGGVRNWVYQLGGYHKDKLDQLAQTKTDLIVIDLARDSRKSPFTAPEIAALKASGKKVLAYFEIGSIESYRPEYETVKSKSPDLLLHRWPDFPKEMFSRYWDERWWNLVVRPKVQQAINAGFDGIYMDTPLAYEEIRLSTVPGETRDSLGRKMVDLIVRISRFAKGQKPGFLIFPQNSPELRKFSGYTQAIDGIGMEDMFYRGNKVCKYSFCRENLAEARELRKAGKLVLVVDYPTDPSKIAESCRNIRAEGFVPYVTRKSLNRITPRCP